MCVRKSRDRFLRHLIVISLHKHQKYRAVGTAQGRDGAGGFTLKYGVIVIFEIWS